MALVGPGRLHAPGAKPRPTRGLARCGTARPGKASGPFLQLVAGFIRTGRPGAALIGMRHRARREERRPWRGEPHGASRPRTRFSPRRPPPRAERPPRSTSLLLPPSLFRPGALRGESSCSGRRRRRRPPTSSGAPSRRGAHRRDERPRVCSPGSAAERAREAAHRGRNRPRRQPRRAASSTLLASSASQPARPATPACSSARPLTSGPIAPPHV